MAVASLTAHLSPRIAMCTLVLRTASHPVHPGDSCDIIDVMDTLKEWKEDPFSPVRSTRRAHQGQVDSSASHSGALATGCVQVTSRNDRVHYSWSHGPGLIWEGYAPVLLLLPSRQVITSNRSPIANPVDGFDLAGIYKPA